jgi:hypothetical protein
MQAMKPMVHTKFNKSKKSISLESLLGKSIWHQCTLQRIQHLQPPTLSSERSGYASLHHTSKDKRLLNLLFLTEAMLSFASTRL